MASRERRYDVGEPITGAAMLRRHYNLLLAGVWLSLAVVMLFPELVLPADVRRQIRLAGPLAGVLAAVFALYNLVRWWAYRRLYRDRAERLRQPLARRSPEHDVEPYTLNPELDFFKVPDVHDTPRAARGERKNDIM